MKIKDKITSFFSEYACIVFLVVALMIAGLTSEKFFTLANLQNLLKQGSVLAVLAVGMGFVLMSGCIDLTVGANMAIAALITINLHQVIGVFPSILLAMAVSIAISCLNMLIIYITKARAMEIMMITFGLKMVYRGIAQAVTGNAVFKYNGKGLFAFLGKGLIFGTIPMIAIIMFVVLVLLGIVLGKMEFGHRVIYVGINPEASRLAGISVAKTRFICFVIAGICCAIAGTLLASRTGAIKALSGDEWEMDAVCALAIGGYSMTGGFGSAWRCIVGVYVYTIIKNILNLLGADAYVQIVAVGLILVFAVWVDIYLRVVRGGKSR